MSGYMHSIGKALPFSAMVTEDEIPILVDILFRREPLLYNGSSFAVTADPDKGYRWLWMSETSATRLKRMLGDRIQRIQRPEGEDIIDHDHFD